MIKKTMLVARSLYSILKDNGKITEGGSMASRGQIEYSSWLPYSTTMHPIIGNRCFIFKEKLKD